MEHGRLECSRYRDELVVGAGTAGPGQDGDPARSVEDLGGGSQGPVIWPENRFRLENRSHLPPGRALAQEDLPVDDNDRDASLFKVRTHLNFEDSGELLGDAHQLAVDAALPEKRLWVGFLEVATPDLLSRDMGCDSEDGHTASVGIEQPVDEVEVPRTAARSHHGKVAGNRSLPCSGKRRSLLVADVFPGDAAIAAQRVGEAVERIARETVDTADS